MATILVIDDLEGVQRYFVKMLTDDGHTVLTADNGVKGTELAQNPDVQLILTDLMMPGELSEIELVKKLRELRPECPIIVCSGYPTQDRILECEQLGIIDFLSKPFEIAYIKPIIERLLNESTPDINNG